MKAAVLALILLAASDVWAGEGDVRLSVSGLAVTLDNGLAHFSFAADASAKVVGRDAVNLVENLSGTGRDPSRLRSFYLDYHAGGVTHFKPESLQVIEQSPARAHVAWYERNGKLDLEYHLVMEKGEPGLYSYVLAKNSQPAPLLVSELRTIYRYDAGKLDHLYTAQGSSKPPLYPELEKLPLLQDETWRLPDGSAYSKYDLVDYQRGNAFWGAYGSGYGAWLIPLSHDYYSGGPLKQDLMVHQDAIVLNYLTGAHMGTPDMIAPPGWHKLYGPWLIYLNRGDAQTVIADAAAHAAAKQSQWPLKWMNDADYPLQRASVRGQLAGRSGEIFNVVLAPQAGDPELQTQGYLYATQSEVDGRFRLGAVRPGQYWLTVYSQTGYDQGLLYQQPVTISAGDMSPLTVELPPPGRHLWRIGVADKTAAGFKLADQPRNMKWMTAVPAALGFTVGQQVDADWYYAQTQPGDWRITYREAAPAAPRRLNIAFAAASSSGMQKPTTPKMTVLLNGEKIAEIAYPNDKTLYRGGMRNGQYHQESIDIPPGLLRLGDNTFTLRNRGGAFMYDAINLEAR